MKTLIGIVMDESSSMFCRKQEVIDGFNHFIEDQKKIVEDTARLFMVKFNSTVTVVHSGISLEEIVPLTNSDYQPKASTALYDAIAQCIRIMDEEKTSEERAICVIITDGQENCSRRTTLGDVKSIIKTHEQNDWIFLYIGVEIAEWVKKSGMRATHCYEGFSPSNTPVLQTQQMARNTKIAFDCERQLNSREMLALNSAISDYRHNSPHYSEDPFSSTK